MTNPGLLPRFIAVDTLHFAYGSNMVAGQMALRCPDSQPVGTAPLCGWRFRINSEGWATIVPEAGAVVYGRLWLLPPEDEAALDLYEDMPSGLYTKQTVPVVQNGEGIREAMVYLATDSRIGKPVARYLDPILSAAEGLGFPGGYLDELRRWSPT